jgi:hypothetical protein
LHDKNIPIASSIANEPFHGKKSSKQGWNKRGCGEIGIIGYIGINNNAPRWQSQGWCCFAPAIAIAGV